MTWLRWGSLWPLAGRGRSHGKESCLSLAVFGTVPQERCAGVGGRSGTFTTPCLKTVSWFGAAVASLLTYTGEDVCFIEELA